MNAEWVDLGAPEQWLSLVGSVLILGAYALMVARPRLARTSYALSLAGGICLLVTAWIYHNAGLMFLEVSWIGINLWGLCKPLRV